MLNKLLLFLILISISFYSKSQNDTSSYSFFVAGHTYGVFGVNNVGLHPPFKNKFNYIKDRSEIKMGFLTGDIVLSPSKLDWDEVDDDIDSLGMPVYLVAGNHEMDDRDLFESRYGRTYSRFSYKEDLFIILDPNKDNWSIKGDQLQFLENTLDSFATNSQNIFVFFHQVLWSIGNNRYSYITTNSDEGLYTPINFWTTIIPMFEELSNRVIMFSGDVGASWTTGFSYDIHKNISFISSGMGGTRKDNFIVVNVDSNKQINYDLICLESKELNCLGELEDYKYIYSLQSEYFRIFPNPSNGNLKILTNIQEESLMQIFNSKGQMVLERNLDGGIVSEFDLNGLPSGVYSIKMISEEVKYVQKLILI